MPRRRPSFVPLLIVAAMLAHVAAVRQSAVAQPPPDVPKSTLALHDSPSTAGNTSKSGILLTAANSNAAVPAATRNSIPAVPAASSRRDAYVTNSATPRKIDPPTSAAPTMLNPDASPSGSAEMLSPPSMQPGCQPPPTPPANCPPPTGPFRSLWNLPVRTADWIFNPPPRHRGIGQPLTRESWRYRPFSLGLFVGYINGGTLIDNWTGSSAAPQGGFRLGWDPAYYWGCEFRFAACSMGQWDSADAIDFAELQNGTYHSNRDVSMELWDLSVIYYPWGDSTWRPYFLTGLGGAQLGFDDSVGNHWSRQSFAMPIALGFKYRYNSRFAFRFEVADNIVFGSGQVETVHHVSVTGGLEIRFGGQRSVYWPQSPGKNYW